ncbi:MAG: NAD(P)/FAD-dependent oxidoreductase [Defluviitaleaceae bacterium]|nr:NAD(P)/FAD-dependent oxidoreductase [Defluviitaleaceae bacterium]
MQVDVIVIGGGTAGLMAAIAAGSKGARVRLIEKGNRLGNKIAISGGGRCNVTNRKPVAELIQHIPGNGRFLYSAFSTFNNEDLITFFENAGVPLKEEDHGRMFPVSNSAESVIEVLINQLKKYNVNIQMDTSVKTLTYIDGQVTGVVLKNEQYIACEQVIVAVGGKSVPQTGSTGDGYAWAKKAGHTITELFPTEVPITSQEGFIQKKTLQGLSLRNVALKVINPKGKVVITHQMDMIFTHFGISGPAALRCSQFVYQTMKKFNVNQVQMELDLFPEVKADLLFQNVTQQLKKEGKKAVKNSLKSLIPDRFLQFILKRNQIPATLESHHVSNEKILRLVQEMKHFSFHVNGTLSIEKAFVTGGGVSVKEINPKEMSSKLMKGLYFCGEILDIHGYTGGYNITAAFVTGRLAGIAASSVKNLS